MGTKAEDERRMRRLSREIRLCEDPSRLAALESEYAIAQARVYGPPMVTCAAPVRSFWDLPIAARMWRADAKDRNEL